MARLKLPAPRIAGIATCVPPRVFDNTRDTTAFTAEEVRKVKAMAGVAERRVVDPGVCTSDLCVGAAEALLAGTGVDRGSIDALVLVTQTPDYLMPSSSCLVQERLGLGIECAAFDLNLGCSGYPYGLWLAASMLSNPGIRRVLLLHGETPTLYADEADRSVSLLFGDAGSATLLDAPEDGSEWSFVLRTDGAGANDLIIEAGGFRDRFNEDRRKHQVVMNGANVFNFTIRVLPELIRDTLELAGTDADSVDYFILHQSNQFIMNHICKKTRVPRERVPMVLDRYGNTGGPSVPLTITQGALERPADRPLRLLLLGYGVGLSWGSALVGLEPGVPLLHGEWSPS